MSNILSVFNPPAERNFNEEENLDCLPCQVMNSFLAIGFGTYLASGRAITYSDKDKKKGVTLKEFERRNPLWWRNSIRSIGGGLLVYGVIRGSEGWIWNKDKKYQKLT
ncbi:Dmo2p NDAI_0A01980 [Naumovozyma dairenensis CBS 421]|uniref:DUF4536 domain-containing protein n=1 Tax=Naumovozyma dairenensis (strain ATCC 10597 / BCRC 20456 / CBS 421 / NBRC 0211 / NRRL Y-12639) TaxID=1071378 RepID=G0W3G8_NAUDC|nr:hypothetical protein NDAI_0A01980 [Naumovozyma dairenensis CBS 421]CCD22356.1 hypothetical protein NDAI_0A01980 [Naumovozyma dairenensis CBS 421]